MVTIATDHSDGLWAITSYFNPVGYRRRIENYRHFRERLPVPLVAVELAYHSEFELGDGDADILVRLRGRDVMWQKERLLNIALEALPETCTKVAWIDCDVIFADEKWPEKAIGLLDRASLIQLFSRVHYMPPDVPPESICPDVAEARRVSLASAIAAGLPATECFDDADRRIGGAVDFVDGDLFHLWHGKLVNRRLRERHVELRKFEFDPTLDIALAENSAWRWSSDKPGMHAFLRERFASRQEDG
jgi:hypothetical protein